MELEKYQKSYHVDQKGKQNPLCILLDCYEQPSYFELKKSSTMNPWIFFCDDINVKLFMNAESIQIYPNSTGIKKTFQKIESWHITQNHFTQISSILKQKDSLLLKTAFNYVPDYAWWGEGFENPEYYHTGHYCYIIGEDKDAFFIADSPLVLLNIEDIRLQNNKAIVKIPKQHFEEAFYKFCQIESITYQNLPSTPEQEFQYFQQTLTKICLNYYVKKEYSPIGKEALHSLKHLMENNDIKVLNNVFGYHMIISRRIILEKSLYQYREHFQNYDEICDLLKQSITYWKKIKTSADQYVFEEKEPNATIKHDIDNLLQIEQNLIECLSKNLQTT